MNAEDILIGMRRYMGCRIWCVVDKENTCCCLKCEEYEHCDMVCDSLDSYEYMEECPDYVKENEDE